MDIRLCPACQRVHASGRECPDCREPFVLVGEDYFVGKRIGKYQVESVVGLGGMGIVYRVRHTGLGRPAALKIVIPELSREEVVRRFHQEARILGSLKHPNIVEVYDLDVASWGFPYIVMEFLEGRSLKAEIARHPSGMPYPHLSRLFRPMVSAVGWAHGRGVIHRDLKPDNVFLQEAGGELVVKVLDFGLAKIMAAGRERNDLTRSGAVMGTPNYIAPEQLAGEEAGPAADQYALGLIAAEMLTGRAMRDGLSIAAIVQGAAAEPVDPAKFAGIAGAPAGLGAAIARATQPNPAHRFLHVQGLLDALDPSALGALSAPPASATQIPLPPPDAGGRGSTLPRSPKTRRWVAAGILLAVGAGLWGLRAVRARATPVGPAVSLAVVSFDNRTGNDAYDYLQDAIPNLLITSLEQSGGVRVTTWERLHDLLRQRGGAAARLDASVGLELCAREGIRALVTGSFVKAGDTFITDVKVLDVGTRELLRAAQARGDGVESILTAQVDALSGEIGRGMAATSTAAEAAAVTGVTTDSLEAYNYFLRGRAELERYNYSDARVFLAKAVELDPQFAMAWADLGWAYSLLVDEPRVRECFIQAKALAGRAGEKERLMIEALHASYVEHDEPRNLALLNELVRRFPEEKWAYYNRGLHYMYSTLQLDRAAAEFQRALDLDPDYAPALNELAYTFAKEGAYPKALELFRRYASVCPGDPNPFDSMGDVLVSMGRLDEAEAKYAEALSVKPDWPAEYALAYIRALHEDYAAALAWADGMARTPAPSRKITMGLWWGGFYRLWLGEPREALRRAGELRRRAREDAIPVWERNADLLEAWARLDLGETPAGLELLKKVSEASAADDRPHAAWHHGIYLYYHAMAALRGGDPAAAEADLQNLEGRAAAAAPGQREETATLVALLRAEVLIVRGDLEGAVTSSRRAGWPPIGFSWPAGYIRRHNEPWLCDQGARALAGMGRTAEAIAEYGRLAAFDPKGPSRRLINPRYHLRLSALYEKAGMREKAAASCRHFLDLWKDASPSRPEITEARARLARCAG